MHARRAIALAAAAALLALLVPARAFAWQEAHQTGDDMRVRVEADGTATVEHAVRWNVLHGPVKWIDLVNVDPAASVEPEVAVTAEDGRALTARAERRDDRTVRVATDDPHAFMRGSFTFDVRWRVDLAASRALTRDGATWRLAWSAPVATDGFDAARTVLDLPAAPDAPQPIVADTGLVDAGAVASVRREPGRDVLELVRAHVARGESVSWTVRLDPRALPRVVDPRLRPPSEAKAPPEPDRVREASLAAALAALALAFGLLVRRRARAFAAACTARRGSARGLLPLRDDTRAAIAGVALAAGAGLQVAGEPTWGAVAVALATLAAAMRAPAMKPVARGPGRWLALRPEDAFAADDAPRPNPLAALGLAALVVAAAAVARRLDAEAPWLVVLDAGALVPLLLTGGAAQLPPDGARSAAPWLARVFRKLKPVPALRVAPWGRVTLDGSRTDELRLLVLPRAAMPGVVGVEVGLAWSGTPVGWTSTPEVLARVLDGSAAAAKLARELPGTRVVPGRRADERVMRLLPRAPTRAGTIALVRSLADALTDRRVAVPARPWTEPERRRPANRPAPPTAAAA